MKKLLAGFGFACLGLVACTGAAEEAGSSNAAISGGISHEAVGVYKLEANESFGATLSITSVSPFLFDLTVVRKGGGGAMGDLVQAMARVEDGRAVFAPADDCAITIRPRADGIELRQAGSCKSEGFGSYVDGSGMYIKSQAEGEAEGEGEHEPLIFAEQAYALQNGRGMTASFDTLHVTESEMFFDLTASSDRGGYTAIFNGRAAISDDKTATYFNGDCKIVFTFKRWGADLVQTGSCSIIQGAGPFDLSGDYAETEGDEHDF